MVCAEEGLREANAGCRMKVNVRAIGEIDDCIRTGLVALDIHLFHTKS